MIAENNEIILKDRIPENYKKFLDDHFFELNTLYYHKFLDNGIMIIEVIVKDNNLYLLMSENDIKSLNVRIIQLNNFEYSFNKKIKIKSFDNDKLFLTSYHKDFINFSTYLQKLQKLSLNHLKAYHSDIKDYFYSKNIELYKESNFNTWYNFKPLEKRHYIK